MLHQIRITLQEKKSNYYQKKCQFQLVALEDREQKNNFFTIMRIVENFEKLYLSKNLTNRENLHLLVHQHHITRSIRTLKRICKKMRLFQRNNTNAPRCGGCPRTCLFCVYPHKMSLIHIFILIQMGFSFSLFVKIITFLCLRLVSQELNKSFLCGPKTQLQLFPLFIYFFTRKGWICLDLFLYNILKSH